MDLMVPLRVQIDATSCTAIPQPMHTLQEQEDTTSTTTSARVSIETATQTATTTSTSDTTGTALSALLQGVQVPAESVRFVQVANPWPNHTIFFESSLELPLCVSSTPILASGPAGWVTLHNHRTEPVSLNASHQVGTIEATKVMGPQESIAGASPLNQGELVPSHLSPVQQCQLTHLLEQYRGIFSCSEDIGQTPALEHSRDTGATCEAPYRQQNLTVWREEAEQVQQMLESGAIHPSNSP